MIIAVLLNVRSGSRIKCKVELELDKSFVDILRLASVKTKHLFFSLDNHGLHRMREGAKN